MRKPIIPSNDDKYNKKCDPSPKPLLQTLRPIQAQGLPNCNNSKTINNLQIPIGLTAENEIKEKKVGLANSLRKRPTKICISRDNKENGESRTLPPLTPCTPNKVSNLFFYYISEVSKQMKNGGRNSLNEPDENLFVDHMLLSVCTRRAHRYTHIPIEPHHQINLMKTFDPTKMKEIQNGKKILIFDMDETLIHAITEWSNFTETKYHDQHTITIESNSCSKENGRKSRSKLFDGHKSKDEDNFKEFLEGERTNRNKKELRKIKELINIKVNIRPHVREVLKRLSEYFILGLFTAAEQNYADEAIKLIDPNLNLFSFKLYREHCTSLCSKNSEEMGNSRGNEKIKDIRILESINPSQIVLIDNSPVSYLFQPENAIPIIPFTSDGGDDQILKLESFLHQHILKSKDVRLTLSSFFRIADYHKYDNVKEIMERIFKNNKVL